MTTSIYNGVEADRGSMDTVTVRKDRLIETLQQNRDAHRAEFEKALEGYRKRSVELLEQHIERIRRGKVEQVLVSLPMPQDHTNDYNRALDQMDWTIQDEIELSSREFDQYVRDQWSWKNEFTTTNSMYTGTR